MDRADHERIAHVLGLRPATDRAPPIIWRVPLAPVGPPDDPAARLIGRLQILGVDFHANAEAVHDDADFCQVPDCADTYAEDIQALTDGAAQTINIDGRAYLLVIAPFQR
jgi:hypothetical protein